MLHEYCSSTDFISRRRVILWVAVLLWTVVLCCGLSQKLFAGYPPYGAPPAGPYTPQELYHGYYPTKWNCWPAGWQPAVHQPSKTKRPAPRPTPAARPAAPAETPSAPSAPDDLPPPTAPELPAEEEFPPLPGAPGLDVPPTETPPPAAPGQTPPAELPPGETPTNTPSETPTETEPPAEFPPTEALPGDAPTDPLVPPAMEGLPGEAPEGTTPPTAPQSRSRRPFRPQPRLSRPTNEVTQTRTRQPSSNVPAVVHPAGANEASPTDGWTRRSAAAAKRPAPEASAAPALLPKRPQAHAAAPQPLVPTQEQESHEATGPQLVPPQATHAPAASAQLTGFNGLPEPSTSQPAPQEDKTIVLLPPVAPAPAPVPAEGGLRFRANPLRGQR